MGFATRDGCLKSYTIMNYHVGVFVHKKPFKERVVRIQIKGTPPEDSSEVIGISFREIIEDLAGYRWIIDLRYCNKDFSKSEWMPHYVNELTGTPHGRIAVVGEPYFEDIVDLLALRFPMAEVLIFGLRSNERAEEWVSEPLRPSGSFLEPAYASSPIWGGYALDHCDPNRWL